MNDNTKTNVEIQGLFAHDNTGWQDRAVVESNGSPICLWWHQLLPSKYQKEIMDILRGLVENEKTFDFYYIQNNYARYKATIIDFSTMEEYESKVPDWRNYKPCWLETDFEEYRDGIRSAAIVFLASKFEKLTVEVPVDHFVRYKNIPYNVRGGLAAFSKIQTNEE